MKDSKKLHIVLISVHGLIRNHDLELGRDSDTGGQTKYVVDFAAALAEQDNVAKVDLITRKICDTEISEDYSRESEPLSDNANILRFECGPQNYIVKEQLWDYLDSFVDNIVDYYRDQGQTPDIIHSHYADAGYVATRLSHILRLPFIHTGHSLGRDKRQRLLAAGLSSRQLDEQYRISQRIEAEEETLANAERIITSTHQEIEEQYELYDYYRPESMTVIPPGTDLTQFHPPELGEERTPIYHDIKRFLDEPDKPMVLSLSRPDPRKNIPALLHAYGQSKELQETANLVIIAGTRDDIRDMEEGAESVLTEILTLIDYYDLYGKVAIPKKHRPDEVAAIFRLAASSQGVFINPAFTEPFGLTLLEAAASGLPFIATENGGPVDIVKNCNAGELIDPTDIQSITTALTNVLTDRDLWRKYSSNALKNVAKKYSWQTHAERYLELIEPVINNYAKENPTIAKVAAYRKVNKLLVLDLDNLPLADIGSLDALMQRLKGMRSEIALAVTTKSTLNPTLAMLKKYGIKNPDILITASGTTIHYSKNALIVSNDWRNHVDHNWNPRAIRNVLDEFSLTSLSPEEESAPFKLSYSINIEGQTEILFQEVTSALRKNEHSVNVGIVNGNTLVITPARASKALAIHYIATVLDVPMDDVLIFGGDDFDRELLAGNSLSAVVGNIELDDISAESDIYCAEDKTVQSLFDAISHYNFFGNNHLGDESDFNSARLANDT